MTDERIDDLDAAVGRLPPGSGVVFRHYATPPAQRRALFDAVRRIARRRRHVLLLAATPVMARAWGADGAHNRSLLKSCGLRSVAVHSGRERILARRIGADIMFVSPVFPTRSHSDAVTLGVVRTGLLAGRDRPRAIALGGLNRISARQTAALKLRGWAAIDGLS
jgi:thiamine-phosphate pyrophosphorylase